MTLPASPNPISVSLINTEVGRGATRSSDLAFLRGLIKPEQRASATDMNEFHGKAFYNRNADGNCNNGNCGTGSGNCGDHNCVNCYNTAINCANCDTQNWLQTNCNCACTYNCTSNQVSLNCNCSKIICTKLFQFKLMSAAIYQADQEFGQRLAETNPDVYNGYRAWADIVVDWMEGNGPNILPWIKDDAKRNKILEDWSINWAHDIATPWAEEMAYIMEQKEHGSLTGKMLMWTGVPICKVVGVCQRWFGPRKEKAGFVRGSLLVAMFMAFKIVVECGRFIESLQKKTKTV